MEVQHPLPGCVHRFRVVPVRGRPVGLRCPRERLLPPPEERPYRITQRIHRTGTDPPHLERHVIRILPAIVRTVVDGGCRVVMTGNVIFLGFALAGEETLSIAASLAALGSFLLRVVTGGRLAARLGQHRGRHLGVAATVAVVPMVGALISCPTSRASCSRPGATTPCSPTRP